MIDEAGTKPVTDFQIMSPAFRDGSQIPKQYSHKGQNINPPLNILHVPESTQSLALIMHDPDAPVSDYVHWLLWDIPASTETIPANSVPVGAVTGSNSSDETSYFGPAPPPGSGTHRYMFELYALDNNPGLPAGSNCEQLQEAMKDHIIDTSTLTGIFSAS